MARRLSNEGPALFTLLSRPGMDATSWRADQAMRPAVVNRRCGVATRPGGGPPTAGC